MTRSYLTLLILPISFSSLILADDVRYFSSYKPAGLQSGPDKLGSTFASSATYSVVDNSILLTGTTWGRFFESRQQKMDEDYDEYDRPIENPVVTSGCFLAVASLPGSTENQNAYNNRMSISPDDGLFWSHKERMHAPSKNEACNAVHSFSETASVLVAGHTEEKRNVTVNVDIRAEEIGQFGLLLDLDWNVAGDKSFTTVGGQLLKDTKQIYPTAMTSKTGNEEDGLFVVSMETKNQVAKHIDLKEGDQEHDPEEYFKYGVGFGMRVARYDFSVTHPTSSMTVKHFDETWAHDYSTDQVEGDVYVTDIVYLRSNLLLVVGSTTGQGEAFGADGHVGGDFDGYVTKVNPDKGGLVVGPNYKSSKRIQSSNHRANDYIHGVCNDPSQSNTVYLVGTTEGHLPDTLTKTKGTAAFIIKFDVLSMESIWTQQIGSHNREKAVRGRGCTVTPDGQFLWVGGNVQEDGIVNGSGIKKSFGGQDIFVAGVDIETGEVVMVKQMGTSKDDEVALRGGIASDMGGNAVIIGNTYGSFYRERGAEETSADVFVLTISALTGEFVAPVETQQKISSWGTSLLVVGIITMLASCAYYMRRHRGEWKNSSLAGLCNWRRLLALRRRGGASSVATDRTEVTPYLRKYAIEDLELKHSATGGWHCNFVGNLASGNYFERESESVLPETVFRAPNRDAGSEVYLYCDADPDDNMDSSARSTSGLLRSETNSAYGDLVEAYNSAYTDDISRVRNTLEGKPAWGKDII